MTSDSREAATAVRGFVQPISATPGGPAPERVLFIGMGQTAVGWYRCYLPAMFLGADWIGVAGEPPHLRYLTGLVKGMTQLAPFESYDVIVIQQPRGPKWLKLIRGLQARGIKVIFEVDDYLHGIRKLQDHDFARDFGKRTLAELELCMGACDAIITSTEFIARRYRRHNPRVYVCQNGVDAARYALTRPKRDGVNIGWAGATGHRAAAAPWIERVGTVMAQREGACFVSIGQDFAEPLRASFGSHRALSIPFTLIDTYPSAMTLLDVALAPAGKGNFFRGKSDLRWVEAGALGIPTIADPEVYPHIVHGVNGFHAFTPEEAGDLMLYLVDEPDVRTRVGAAVREEIRATRDMAVMARSWADVLAAVAPDSARRLGQ